MGFDVVVDKHDSFQKRSVLQSEAMASLRYPLGHGLKMSVVPLN